MSRGPEASIRDTAHSSDSRDWVSGPVYVNDDLRNLGRLSINCIDDSHNDIPILFGMLVEMISAA